MAELAERITVDPEQCGGRPCIRGMRIRVSDVLDLLANGLAPEQVIEELPDLEPEDVQACLRFASQRLDHPVLAGVIVWIDAQLSPTLARWITETFRLQAHAVRALGLRDAKDAAIFEAARQADAIVMTKESH